VRQRHGEFEEHEPLGKPRRQFEKAVSSKLSAAQRTGSGNAASISSAISGCFSRSAAGNFSSTAGVGVVGGDAS
jgi:hypothetical protein